MSSKTPPTPGERQGIAVLGGSFNPPHCTHQRLATAALDHLPISELRIVPAGTPPHKDGDLAPAADRLAMCRLAFADRPGIVVDDREVRRSGPSFTVDTLQELATEAPGRALFFLIGSDNLRLLPTWRDHHRLLALCTVVTYPRAGHSISATTLRGLDLTRPNAKACSRTCSPDRPTQWPRATCDAAGGAANGTWPRSLLPCAATSRPTRSTDDSSRCSRSHRLRSSRARGVDQPPLFRNGCPTTCQGQVARVTCGRSRWRESWSLPP
jgi:nicotinate-nucleotide adenylyltransferase